MLTITNLSGDTIEITDILFCDEFYQEFQITISNIESESVITIDFMQAKQIIKHFQEQINTQREIK